VAEDERGKKTHSKKKVKKFNQVIKKDDIDLLRRGERPTAHKKKRHTLQSVLCQAKGVGGGGGFKPRRRKSTPEKVEMKSVSLL